MIIDLRDLHWALIASKYRSLRQAADVLNIRQSTLSRGLRNLEHRLGAVLFQRTNGGTRPTAAGQEFLKAAKKIVEEAEAITEQLKARSRGESGRLTIGVHASLSAGNLRATVMDHRLRFPDVETHLVDGSSDRLISDLSGCAIDVAFVAEGSSQWYGGSLPVWSERVVVGLKEGHLLSIRSTIHWSDLKQECILLPQRGPGLELYQLLVKKLGCVDLHKLVCHDVALDRFLMLVGAGCGTLLALEGATGAIYPGVVFREVHDDQGPTRLNFRACWQQTNSNPALEPFLKMLQERYPDLSGAPGV